MNKKPLKNKKWIFSIIILLLFCSVIYLVLGAKGITPDITSRGHGAITNTGVTTLLQSLGMVIEIDYVDDDGVEYCYDDICWLEAEDEYTICIEEEPEVIEFGFGSSLGFNIFMIAGPLIVEDIEECEIAYEEKMLNECNIDCGPEIYLWDGSSVNNINDFFETNYPRAYSRFNRQCEFWLFEGTWINDSNEVGCSDFGFFGDASCTSESILSAKEVCEKIGKTFTCNENKIVCEEVL